MAKFDAKSWNPAVFQKYLNKIPSTRLNMFKKAGILQVNQSLADRLKDGVGGNYIIEPIKGNLDGNVINYDGATNITATSRKTFEQGKIVVGRAKAWTEKDFSTDISGAEFLPVAEIAGEVAEYFDGVDQDDILAILKGIFLMSDTAGAAFVNKHTYDVTGTGTGSVGAGTLNKAITKACGDRKKEFSLVIMHSDEATELETLQLIAYLTYTDANGIQRDLEIGTWNGRMVFVDDDCPVESGYYASTSGAAGAVKVVASDATTGQVNLADVKATDFYPDGVKANDYVVAGTRYITYVMGKGFIEYADCGAKVPNEMDRDPKTNGGEDTLYVRQRKLYAPKYISFTKQSMASLSPTAAELATGANWEIVNDGDAISKTYVSDKLIPVARIIAKVN